VGPAHTLPPFVFNTTADVWRILEPGDGTCAIHLGIFLSPLRCGAPQPDSALLGLFFFDLASLGLDRLGNFGLVGLAGGIRPKVNLATCKHREKELVEIYVHAGTNK
jgi:hypothetical protein